MLLRVIRINFAKKKRWQISLSKDQTALLLMEPPAAGGWLKF
jgi:hypothetical protein